MKKILASIGVAAVLAIAATGVHELVSPSITASCQECGPGRQCPPGLRCVNGRCVK